MVKKLGLIGLSEGNGHPFSFSSIINGYNDQHLKDSGWDVIYDYVKKRDVSEIGIKQASVSHVWTQDEQLSNKLRMACNIQHSVKHYEDMIGQVDGVIIARDDYENHLEMTKPFIEAGVKVFVDKPLTIDLSELQYFKNYILSGQLMSMSGMRYAVELDDIRCNLNKYGELKLIQSSVINDWEKYGIHIIDAVLGFLPFYPISIQFVPGGLGTYIIEFENELTWIINVLEEAPKTFNINVWGQYQRASLEIKDNFSMFRRLLWRFIQLVDIRKTHYAPKDILMSISLLIGGKISKTENRKVFLREFDDILK